MYSVTSSERLREKIEAETEKDIKIINMNEKSAVKAENNSSRGGQKWRNLIKQQIMRKCLERREEE